MRFPGICLLIAVVCIMLPPASNAGSRLECENWAYDSHGSSGRVTIYIEGKHIRFDEASGENSAIWFVDGDEVKMTSLNHQRLEYVHITKDDTKKFFQKIEGWVEQLESFVAGQPKEQRDQIKQQATPLFRIWNALEAADEKDEKFKYEKGDETTTVKDIECQHYRGYYDKRLFHEVWMAPFDKLEIGQADVATLLNWPEKFRGMFSLQVGLASIRGSASAGELGMPMRLITYDGETKTMRFEILEIHKEDVDASLFEIPSQYDEVEFEDQLEQMGRM